MGYEFGDSVLARRTAWMLERYANDDLTAADALEQFSPTVSVDDVLRRFRVFRRPIDEVIGYEEVSPTRAMVAVVCEGKRARVNVALTDEPGGPIRSSALVLEPAPGVVVREAREDDGPGIIELERRCPVVTGGVEVIYDRGDDYFAQHRLMGHHIQSVAEYEGRIVGTFADSLRTVRVAGTEHPSTYRFHLRVDPACRGMAIFPALNVHQSELLWEASPNRRAILSYQAAENATVAGTAGEAQQSLLWTVPIERLLIDCEANAGPSVGRRATPADATRIAALLDMSHGSEELAPVFEPEQLATRLGRSPLHYSWSNLLVGERAVVGVWDQGLGVTRRHPDGRVAQSVRATALDWGCEEGAEDELRALVRAWCSTLVASGTTHLSLFTSRPSPQRAAFAELALDVEPYRIMLGVPEPPTAAERGVYVDPVWF